MGLQSKWLLGREQAESNGGMVAAKTLQAAEAGANVLRNGGNAVDAAVATAFAAGVAEPWMNGLGGGGYLVRYDPRSQESSVVAFPMISAAAATSDMFELTGGGPDAALFGWPAVVNSANIVGPQSVAVPGTVAGLDLALSTYGTLSLAQAMDASIELAENGIPVSWHTSMEIGRDLANLRRFPATAELFCPDGIVPWSVTETAPTLLYQKDLATTLKTIARDGADAFYHGSIGAAIGGYFEQVGAPLRHADLKRYRARIEPANAIDYEGSTLFVTGLATGGTTLAESMKILNGSGVSAMPAGSPEAFHLMAQAFSMAFADRFAYLADPDHVESPIDQLLSDSYTSSRRSELTNGPIGPPRAGSRAALGVSHQMPGSIPDYTSGGSTTHLSVIDKDGVCVSLTQTLLSLWGSRVVVPGTGIMMNNGMMWFDPQPGRPNSIAGNKRPLSNMSPAIVATPDGRVAALGSSGGRKILNCVAQLAMSLSDHHLPMQEVVSSPRIDRSTPSLLISDRVPSETVNALKALGHPVVAANEGSFFGPFSSPACVENDGSVWRGGVDPYYYPATAIGVSS